MQKSDTKIAQSIDNNCSKRMITRSKHLEISHSFDKKSETIERDTLSPPRPFPSEKIPISNRQMQTPFPSRENENKNISFTTPQERWVPTLSTTNNTCSFRDATLSSVSNHAISGKNVRSMDKFGKMTFDIDLKSTSTHQTRLAEPSSDRDGVYHNRFDDNDNVTNEGNEIYTGLMTTPFNSSKKKESFESTLYTPIHCYKEALQDVDLDISFEDIDLLSNDKVLEEDQNINEKKNLEHLSQLDTISSPSMVRYRRKRSINLEIDDSLAVQIEKQLYLEPKDGLLVTSSSSSLSTETCTSTSPSSSSTSSPTNSSCTNTGGLVDIVPKNKPKSSTLSLDTLPSDCLIPILSFLKVTDIQRCYTSCRSLHSSNEIMLQVILEVDKYRDKDFDQTTIRRNRTQSLDRGYRSYETCVMPSISSALEIFLTGLVSDRKEKEIDEKDLKYQLSTKKAGIHPNATRKKFNFMQNKRKNSKQIKGIEDEEDKKKSEQNLNVTTPVFAVSTSGHSRRGSDFSYLQNKNRQITPVLTELSQRPLSAIEISLTLVHLRILELETLHRATQRPEPTNGSGYYISKTWLSNHRRYVEGMKIRCKHILKKIKTSSYKFYMTKDFKSTFQESTKRENETNISKWKGSLNNENPLRDEKLDTNANAENIACFTVEPSSRKKSKGNIQKISKNKNKGNASTTKRGGLSTILQGMSAKERRYSEVDPPMMNINWDITCEHGNLKPLKLDKYSMHVQANIPSNSNSSSHFRQRSNSIGSSNGYDSCTSSASSNHSIYPQSPSTSSYSTSKFAKRKLISTEAWKKLRQFYPEGANEFKASTEECSLCLGKVEENKTTLSLLKQQREDEELRGSESLKRLFSRKSGIPSHIIRPNTSNINSGSGEIVLTEETFECPLPVGVYHIVPRRWLTLWRNYIRDVNAPRPPVLDCSCLICDLHGKVFLPNHVEDYLYGIKKHLLSNLSNNSGVVCEILTADEWDELIKGYSYDITIRFGVHVRKERKEIYFEESKEEKEAFQPEIAQHHYPQVSEGVSGFTVIGERSRNLGNFSLETEDTMITAQNRYFYRKEIVWSHQKCNQCNPVFHANYSYNHRVQQLSSSGSTKVKDILNKAPMFAFGNLSQPSL